MVSDHLPSTMQISCKVLLDLLHRKLLLYLVWVMTKILTDVFSRQYYVLYDLVNFQTIITLNFSSTTAKGVVYLQSKHIHKHSKYIPMKKMSTQMHYVLCIQLLHMLNCLVLFTPENIYEWMCERNVY
jgi:hypothetical protein